MNSIVSDLGIAPEFLPEWRVTCFLDKEKLIQPIVQHVKASSAFKAKCAFMRTHVVESSEDIVVQFWKEAQKLS